MLEKKKEKTITERRQKREGRWKRREKRGERKEEPLGVVLQLNILLLSSALLQVSHPNQIVHHAHVKSPAVERVSIEYRLGSGSDVDRHVEHRGSAGPRDELVGGRRVPPLVGSYHWRNREGKRETRRERRGLDDRGEKKEEKRKRRWSREQRKKTGRERGRGSGGGEGPAKKGERTKTPLATPPPTFALSLPSLSVLAPATTSVVGSVLTACFGGNFLRTVECSDVVVGATL